MHQSSGPCSSSVTTMAAVRIEPITSSDDIPTCATICTEAVRPDPMHTFLDRYRAESFYESTVARLTDAINQDNRTDFAFKAVQAVDNPKGGTRDEILGVSHWYVGYVVIPKVDPFSKQVPEEVNEIGPDEVSIGDEEGAVEVEHNHQKLSRARAVMDEMGRLHGNFYVGSIRGKRHVCK